MSALNVQNFVVLLKPSQDLNLSTEMYLVSEEIRYYTHLRRKPYQFAISHLGMCGGPCGERICLTMRELSLQIGFILQAVHNTSSPTIPCVTDVEMHYRSFLTKLDGLHRETVDTFSVLAELSDCISYTLPYPFGMDFMMQTVLLPLAATHKIPKLTTRANMLAAGRTSLAKNVCSSNAQQTSVANFGRML